MHNLNKQNDAFTRALLDKAQAIKKAEKAAEITTSSTDTSVTYDLDDINRHKIDKTARPIKKSSLSE